MKSRFTFQLGLLSVLLACASIACGQKAADAPKNTGPTRVDRGGQEVSFKAADGVTVYADAHWLKDDHRGPLILLFHQAGANARGEYGPIIPRLLEKGFSVLAVDQRSGGDRFGGINRTVQNLPEQRQYSYCEAYPDLEAALAWAKKQDEQGPIIAWGSSYSAGLVFRLAAEHPEELSGVLAFSPAAGPAMGDCSPEHFAARVKTKVLVLRPFPEMERAAAVEQLDDFKVLGFDTYVAAHGVHGSSMLVSNRVDGSIDENWNVVEGFLEEIAKEQAPER